MKPFSKNEILVTLFILFVIVLLTSLNLRVSIRRARDSQRRSDIGAISDALYKYQKDFGFFPPATDDGKILACKGDGFGTIPKEISEEEKKALFFRSLRGCNWGEDALADVNDELYEPYLKVIPGDPKAGAGYSYYYLSDMDRFQLYAYLEGESSEIGFRQGIVGRNLNCGVNICNFGKAYGETPLEKTLQEYENELKKRR